MVRFGVPGQNVDTLSYADGRLATVPTKDAPRDPTVNDKKFPIQTIWRNNITFRECMLVGFASNGDATWSCFTDSAGTVLKLKTDDDNEVEPSGGTIDIDGETVVSGANAKPVFTDGATANTVKIQVQVATDITGAPGDKNDAGLCSFNDEDFVVDADGYVSLTSLPGFDWVEETGATRALLVNQGVMGNRGTAQTFTLPATAAFGDTIKIVNKGAGLISIAQNAGQTLHFGQNDTTTGVGGTLDSTLQWNTITLVCSTLDTDFVVVNAPVGTWDVL